VEAVVSGRRVEPDLTPGALGRVQLSFAEAKAGIISRATRLARGCGLDLREQATFARTGE
jgi:hypothetical protein